jgi:putative intracellular protease/amidase
VLDDTLVVVTSDHGEHLGDHLLFFHGCSLYRQVVEVPLVIVGPNRVPAGRAFAEPVSLRDLPATVLHLLGLGRGATFPGRSLARFWDPDDGEGPPAFEPLLMETDRPTLLTNQGREPAAKGPMKALVAGGMHYIRSGDGREELYALGPDPEERMNVAGFPDAQEALQGFRGALRSMIRMRRPDDAQAAGLVEARLRLGAEVHLMSRLWGQKTQTFVSDVGEPKGSPAETREQLRFMEVDVDLDQVELDDYAAVIMAANYTSVRLRYFEPPPGQAVRPELARSAPAVRFFARAMRDPRIVKGALCLGLWILTPTPELLAGRRVICHEVVLADDTNAGATYTASPNNVVVDGDLVTGRSWHEVGPFVDAIAEQIVHLRGERAAPRKEPASPEPAVPPGGKPRRILVVLSEWGYWGEELLGPLETFDATGYLVDFATPTGKRPVALTPSKDAGYVDPPLNRPVTTAEVARKVRELDDTSPDRSARSRRLDHPISLNELLPERSYWSEPNFVRKMEAYNRALEAAQERLKVYDALLLVGGSGPMVDVVNNQRVHDLVLSFYQADKPIAAECYGVACLAFARRVENRKSIIWAKRAPLCR